MNEQKFQPFDMVRVAKDLGPAMSHFTADVDAIIIHTDNANPEYNKQSYQIFIDGKGRVAWYEEDQLTLIQPAQQELLKQWEQELKLKLDRQGDLKWIFANGKSISESCPGTSANALGKCIGIDNMWGNRGEGFVFYVNAHAVLSHARPFLEKNDLEGWMLYCESCKGFKKEVVGEQ